MGNYYLGFRVWLKAQSLPVTAPALPTTKKTQARTWVAVKELNFSYYIIPPIMENQMEKKMKNEMETGII